MGNGHVGTVGRKRVGWIERVTLTYTCHPVLNRQRVGSCCVDRELSLGLMTKRGEKGEWEKGPRGREYMYTYS